MFNPLHIWLCDVNEMTMKLILYLFFWRETFQSPETLIVDRPTNNQRPTTNDQRPTTNNQRPTTNDQQPKTAEEFTYNGNRAWRHPCPTNNLLEVWQNLAPSLTADRLATQLRRCWLKPLSAIVSIANCCCPPPCWCWRVSIITQSNGNESIIFLL